MTQFFLRISGLSGATATLLGAFAAHALSTSLSATALATFHTANQYHFIHTLALLAVAVLLLVKPSRWFMAAGWLFISGIGLFSGSLYSYSVSHYHPLVFLTPIGGIAFIFGWLCLCLGACNSKSLVT